MKFNSIKSWLLLCVASTFTITADAQESAGKTLAQKLESGKVTEDQLTPQCKQGILEATLAISTGAAALEYSISACEADADKHCLEVPPGEGRLLRCIKANQSRVSPQCVSALKETGLWQLVE
jgi:hypothetical protein